MGAPRVAPPRELEPVEDGPEQPLQIRERDDPVRPAEAVIEFLVHHAVGQEIDERVGLGIDVIAVEEHLRVDIDAKADRSEEHTSELQSLTNLVCRLLLEKKKQNKTTDQ